MLPQGEAGIKSGARKGEPCRWNISALQSLVMLIYSSASERTAATCEDWRPCRLVFRRRVLGDVT